MQTSAAAFAKGLLDLETSGTDAASLIPILVSLVRKDANTLDTLGRGAGTDLADARRELHRLMITDIAANPVSCVEDQRHCTTTMQSRTERAISVPAAIGAGEGQLGSSVIFSHDSSELAAPKGKQAGVAFIDQLAYQEHPKKGGSADELLHTTPSREYEKPSKRAASDHSPQSSPDVRDT